MPLSEETPQQEATDAEHKAWAERVAAKGLPQSIIDELRAGELRRGIPPQPDVVVWNDDDTGEAV